MKKIVKSLSAVFIGILIILVVLEAILQIFSWWQINRYNFQKPVKKSENEIVILTLGDSMTAFGGDNPYPFYLEQILNNSKKINKHVRVINGARIMADSDYVELYVKNNVSRINPDIVTVMIGNNDLTNNYYRKNFNLNINSKFFTFRSINFLLMVFTNIHYNIRRDLVGGTMNTIGYRLLNKKMYEPAKILFQISISIYPNSDRGYRGLIYLFDNKYIDNFDKYSDYDKWNISRIFYSRGDFTNSRRYHNYSINQYKDVEITKKNYQKISQILNSKKIPLVAIQYPRRDVKILKSYLNGYLNTYFVDNNELFEKAVDQYGYDQVFLDAFAGNFGHFTLLGKKIVAENVSKVILEEVLKNEKNN